MQQQQQMQQRQMDQSANDANAAADSVARIFKKGEEDLHRECNLVDTLTMLALGNTLAKSQSAFAILPSEIVGRHIAPRVRELFEQDLEARGLVTPFDLVFRASSPPQIRQRLRAFERSSAQRPLRPIARSLVQSENGVHTQFSMFFNTPSALGFDSP